MTVTLAMTVTMTMTMTMTLFGQLFRLPLPVATN